jgi:hypothetical protein
MHSGDEEMTMKNDEGNDIPSYEEYVASIFAGVPMDADGIWDTELTPEQREVLQAYAIRFFETEGEALYLPDEGEALSRLSGFGSRDWE